MDARDLLEQKDFVPPEIKDIQITDAAINRLLQVGYKQVEFSVEGGGCSGMNYKMTKFDRELNDRDKVIVEEEPGGGVYEPEEKPKIKPTPFGRGAVVHQKW